MSTGQNLVVANREAIRAIATQAKEFQTAIAACTDQFEKGLLIAEGMNHLRGAMTQEVVAPLVALQGSGLGFRTDKDKEGGYAWDVIRDCTIEAWLRGFYHVGNEFNVIAGRFYGAKAGFERKCKSFPGCSGFTFYRGRPEMSGGDAALSYIAEWVQDGEVKRLKRTKETIKGEVIDLRIVVRVNSGQIIDAIYGKADAKMWRAIWEELTNHTDIIPASEMDEEGRQAPAVASKLQRSTLFDETPPEPADPFPASKDALENYDIRITEAKSRPDLQAIAKEIGQDKRLSKEDRGQAMGWVNKKLAGAGR